MIRPRQQAGVTIIELLISVAIFVIITTLVVIGFVDSRKHTDLRLAANLLEANLRQLQSAAIAGQAVEGAVPGGFGLAFDMANANQDYLAYGDTTSYNGSNCVAGTNQRYDYPGLGGGGNCQLPSPVESVLNLYRLPGRVLLDKMYVGGGLVDEINSGRADITFTTPEAVVHARHGQTGSWYDPTNGQYLSQTATGQTIILCLLQPQVSLYRKITIIGLTGQVGVGPAVDTCLP